MKAARRAGIGMAATAAVAGIGLAAGLPATIANAGQKDQASERAISERSISQQRAARVAVRTIERRTGKSARVTDVNRENDWGAQWEVEVTLRNGREFDVYVNRSGRVVKVIRKGRDDWRGGPNRDNQGSAGSVISSSAAAATALAHIERLTGQSARVTGIDREDDYGARWEVEVTLANGFEYDVYIGANGQVIRVQPNGFDDDDDGYDDDDWTPGDGGGSADRDQAAATALAHIERLTGQSARVTGIDREDDYGARWEVEVTLANGFEYDVYIGANGQVIKVEANGFDD